MESGQWLNDTISIWESMENEVDKSCVSINLYSDYFNDNTDQDDERMLDRSERRFQRYVNKKYETSIQRGTLKSSSDWDNKGHPARAKKDIETFILEKEKKHWDDTVMQVGLDLNNTTALEESDIDFAMSTMIELIPSASSTKMNNSISTELEKTLLSAPPSVSQFEPRNMDQSMRGHLAQLSAHAINKISARMSRHDITHEPDGTINNWNFLNVHSDSEDEGSSSNESTILAEPETIISDLRFVNDTPTTVRYKERVMTPKRIDLLADEFSNMKLPKPTIKYADDDISFEIPYKRKSLNPRYEQHMESYSTSRISRTEKPKRRFERQRPMLDLSTPAVYDEFRDQRNESQRTLDRCARLKLKNFMSPSVKQRRDLKRINDQIDNHLRRK